MFSECEDEVKKKREVELVCRAHLSVFFRAPLVLPDVGVHLVAPALRALLSTAPDHLIGDGCPAVAVLRLWTVKMNDDGEGATGVLYSFSSQNEREETQMAPSVAVDLPLLLLRCGGIMKRGGRKRRAPEVAIVQRLPLPSKGPC